MGESTGIQWTDKTWNPWYGCEKVSLGCDNCYMFRDMSRFGKDPAIIQRAAPRSFAAPLGWKQSAKVFTCSWSDFFAAEADSWRTEAWDIIRRTPHLTYQILTKRHGRIARCLPPDWGNGYPNVWLGVTVENQFWADRRIPVLLGTPAALRFLSVEPLLGPIDLASYLRPWRETRFDVTAFGEAHVRDWPRVDWVIVGGESGKDARPFDISRARAVIEHCKAAGVACFVKQLGRRAYLRPSARDYNPAAYMVSGCGHPHMDGMLPPRPEEPDSYQIWHCQICGLIDLRDFHSGNPDEWPEDLRVREFPAVLAGAAR